MYPTTITPQTKSLIQNTAKALLFAGHSVKPSDVADAANVKLHGKEIQKLIDELYDNDLQIRRKIVAEGFYITFTYSRLAKMPKPVNSLRFGYITDQDLAKYDQDLYVAYHMHSQFVSAAIFNTKDKYEARNQYKTLTGAKHNDVRMTKLATFLKK